ncbi:MAG: DUF721 domain-containing protein [Kofleriaceae bacterium]|nr:DUF721 domain-containing protein [Kofleriaceae bacterium]MBP6838264.1 DUF721 domain-containing protein [Kofleriaceae bacterium]MBP9205383.1 DUF721 domain-containing protein [Kofleriaceae bacterium]
MRATRPAAAAVADVLAQRGLTEEIRAQRVVTEWRELVGPRIGARAWPDGLSKRVLWIQVSSSAWLHELTLLKAQLLATLRAALGEPPLFDDLRLHLGSRRPESDDALAGVRARPAPPRVTRPAPTPATGPHRAAIEAETDAVADDELRELIRRVRIRNDR